MSRSRAKTTGPKIWLKLAPEHFTNIILNELMIYEFSKFALVQPGLGSQAISVNLRPSSSFQCCVWLNQCHVCWCLLCSLPGGGVFPVCALPAFSLSMSAKSKCFWLWWDNISFWHLTLAFTFSKTIPPQLGLNLGFVVNYMHSDSPESRKLIFPILTPGPTVWSMAPFASPLI